MKLKHLLVATNLVALGSMSAWAQTTTTSFGPLPGATFGGVGNPTDPVEVTTISGLTGGNTITLGLAAQQRYQNPALAAAAGTYYATTGANYGNPANPASQTDSTVLGSTWDFDFYANIAGGGTLANYTFVLDYALTPGTPVASLGTLNLNGASVAALVAGGDSLTTAEAAVGGLTTVQNSENLDFASLDTSVAGVEAPPAGPFSPNATGDYTFVLNAYDASDNLVGSDEITVDVTAPDAASTLPLLGVGFCALAGLRRRFNRAG